jgi:hypothetical protein
VKQQLPYCYDKTSSDQNYDTRCGGDEINGVIRDSPFNKNTAQFVRIRSSSDPHSAVRLKIQRGSSSSLAGPLHESPTKRVSVSLNTSPRCVSVLRPGVTRGFSFKKADDSCQVDSHLDKRHLVAVLRPPVTRCVSFEDEINQKPISSVSSKFSLSVNSEAKKATPEKDSIPRPRRSGHIVPAVRRGYSFDDTTSSAHVQSSRKNHPQRSILRRTKLATTHSSDGNTSSDGAVAVCG